MRSQTPAPVPVRWNSGSVCCPNRRGTQHSIAHIFLHPRHATEPSCTPRAHALRFVTPATVFPQLISKLTGTNSSAMFKDLFGQPKHRGARYGDGKRKRVLFLLLLSAFYYRVSQGFPRGMPPLEGCCVWRCRRADYWLAYAKGGRDA